RSVRRRPSGVFRCFRTLSCSECSEEFEAEQRGERQADDEDQRGAARVGSARVAGGNVRADMKVEREVANTRTEVMQVSPDQNQQHQLRQRVRGELAELLEPFR